MGDGGDVSRWAGIARFVLVLAALAFATVSVSVVSSEEAVRTTYASMSLAATLTDAVVAFGLLAAGVIAYAVRPRGSIGPLTVLIGMSWSVSNMIGWESGPAVARSLAMVAAPFVLPLVVHLAIAYPVGRVTESWARWVVALAYGVTAVVSVGRALFRDPFLDQYCWNNCNDNAFLLWPDRDVTRLLNGFGLRTTVVIGVLGAGVGLWRLVRATPVARRSLWFVLAPAAGAALAIATYALALLGNPAEDPEEAPYDVLFYCRGLMLAALAAGVGWGAIRTVRAGRAVVRLSEALGTTPRPGSLATVLARTLGDERLDVAYWLPSSQRYVDASGRAVEPVPGPGQAATSIVRAGLPVAMVVHDQALNAERDLERQIGSAARLAVDNERLRAEVLAQLDALRASRSRIVDTADRTRRRLERDLHDGAQQRLLAASFELRLARSAAIAAGDTLLEEKLAAACTQAQEAILELRDLAHGIFPAILSEAGLDPAVRSLALRAPVPVEIGQVVTDRYPTSVETAAYVVVVATVDEAQRGSAAFIAVCITEEGGHLLVELRTDADDGIPEPNPDAADRVGALGGRLVIERGSIRAEIPCGS